MGFSIAALSLIVFLASASAQELTTVDTAKLQPEVRKSLENHSPSAYLEKKVVFQEAVEPDDGMASKYLSIPVPKKEHPQTRQKVWERTPAGDVNKERVGTQSAPEKKIEPKDERSPVLDVHKWKDIPVQKEMHQERSPVTDLKKALSDAKHDHKDLKYIRVRNTTHPRKSVVHLIHPTSNDLPDVLSPDESVRTS